MAKSKLLFEGSDWTFDTIDRIADACAEIADEELGLDIYPNQFEVITSTQMLDAYASIGMPIGYNHWSFGKSFVAEEQKYRSGQSGLAYELVINSNPCINYLMEENSATVQTLVIAHAGFGHNHFFKNNYLFKEWTHADSIVDYLCFAKKYIADCEEKYGFSEVERVLDSAHALRNQGIDKYKRPTKRSLIDEQQLQKERAEYIQSQVNILWQATTDNPAEKAIVTNIPAEPEENILKFIEKNSPNLEPWQREIIRIVRMISQYFYPQRQTKVMNEGFACWTHCYILNRLYDKGLIGAGTMLEFMQVHSNVVYQPNYKQSAQFNPYTLGLNMFRDIERICKDPTEEDKDWFPHIAGENYVEVIRDAVANYRDESFIRQFLSPTVIRDMRMFRIEDADDDHYKVSNIHNRDGYKDIRRALADTHDVGINDPNIQIVNANMNGTRILEVEHKSPEGQLLDEENAIACLAHLNRLWGFDVTLCSVDEQGTVLDEFSTIIAPL